MFRKHAIQVKMVKSPKNATEPTSPIDDIFSEETIQRIKTAGQEFTKYVAITAVAAVGVLKVLDTFSQIAVKKTKSADKED